MRLNRSRQVVEVGEEVRYILALEIPRRTGMQNDIDYLMQRPRPNTRKDASS
jgi:hypothetical protein